MDEFVGLSFFGTLMRQFRETQDMDSPFRGGQGEKIFGAQLDAEFAQRVGQRFQSQLGETIYKKLSRKTGQSKPAAPAQRITRESVG